MAASTARAVLPKDDIRQELDLILASPQFRTSRQLSRFLSYAVEHTLCGTHDHLKEQIIGIEVFGRGEGFDPKADAIVRVQARNLRKRLALFYSNRTDKPSVIIDLPTGSYVPVFHPPGEDTRTRHSSPHAIAIAAAVISAIFAAILVWLVARPSPSEWRITQLTFDAGFTGMPAISNDGRFVVYTSSRAQPGNADLWLHALDGSALERLTTHPDIDTQPDISPRGDKVVFRSYREGGGIYLLDLATRREHLLAPGGFSPRFSPDGRSVAYGAATGRGTGGIFVVPVSGGMPRDVTPQARSALAPIWTPDGRSVVYLDSIDAQFTGFDLWAIRTAAGSDARPVRTHVRELLDSQRLPGITGATYPLTWHDGRLALTLRSGRQAELWTVAISGALKATGRAVQLLAGPGIGPARSSASGPPVLVFGTDDRKNDLWAARLTAGRRSAGPLIRLTHDESLKPGLAGTRPAVTTDGKRLVFASERSGSLDLWQKDLESGVEASLTHDDASDDRPVLDRFGNIAFNRTLAGASSISLLDARTRMVRQICQNCGAIADMSSDGRWILAIQGKNLTKIDVESGAAESLLATDRFGPQEAAYSPDGRWIALALYERGKDELQGYVMPARAPADPGGWSKVHEQKYHLSIHWAPNGAELYYFVSADGKRCLVSQAFDNRTGQLRGKPKTIEHFHDFQFFPWFGSWIAAANGLVVVNISTSRSNVYVARQTP